MISNLRDSVSNKWGGRWIDETDERRRGTGAARGSHLTGSKDVIQGIPTIEVRE
jgi:hypothetical protein